jgi:endoglucanase
LQNSENAALNATEMGRMDAVINYARTKGLKVVINPQNFNKYYGVVVGTSGGVPNSSFADFWSRVATRYLSSSFDHVIFGLTNEPNGGTTAEWTATANAAIAAIRATGSTNRIYVPGNNWTTATNWWTGDNDTVFAPNIVDSGNNYAIELHQYFDSDSSGETDLVVSTTIGSERLQAVTAWARARGVKLFLGEFGVGQSQDSLDALEDMCDFLDANADVWETATYWSAGPWWTNNPPIASEFWVIEPVWGPPIVDKPQMGVLEAHIT